MFKMQRSCLYQKIKVMARKIFQCWPTFPPYVAHWQVAYYSPNQDSSSSGSTWEPKATMGEWEMRIWKNASTAFHSRALTFEIQKSNFRTRPKTHSASHDLRSLMMMESLSFRVKSLNLSNLLIFNLILLFFFLCVDKYIYIFSVCVFEFTEPLKF